MDEEELDETEKKLLTEVEAKHVRFLFALLKVRFTLDHVNILDYSD